MHEYEPHNFQVYFTAVFNSKAAQTALRHEKGLRQHLEAKRYTEQSELNNSTKTVH